MTASLSRSSKTRLSESRRRRRRLGYSTDLCGSGRLEAADEAVLCGEERRSGARGDAELGVDVLDVGRHRPRCDHETEGDLLVLVSAREQAQHLDLAGGQA